MARNRGPPCYTMIICNHNFCGTNFFRARYGTEALVAGRKAYIVSDDCVSGVMYTTGAYGPLLSLSTPFSEMHCVLCECAVGYRLGKLCYFIRFTSVWRFIVNVGRMPIRDGVDDAYNSDDADDEEEPDTVSEYEDIDDEESEDDFWGDGSDDESIATLDSVDSGLDFTD